MSQTLNTVPAFDGTNYGYWKTRMRFFLKTIDCWSIVEIGLTKPVDAALKLVPQKNARLSNDKAHHALCQALSPSEFAKISNCESAQEAWQILETIYEGTKLVKSAKLQMLISRFEEIKMLEEETFWRVLIQDEWPEKLHGESWEACLGCKTHLKNSKIFS
jgi:hypothetical protein